MKIVVTGANGQLGRELLRTRWPDGTELIGLDRAALDLNEPATVGPTMEALAPDVIVNAAAYTAVDAAESDEATALRVNGDAVAELASYASKRGARLAHFSTDYVFDGTKNDWYVEDDPVSPVGAYGRTKLAGEQAAQECETALVFRTSWVYGALGNNFVRTMLRLGAERDNLGVVADQVGCPTAAIDLAQAVAPMVIHPEAATRRLYHLASPESASWFQFARAILAEPIARGRLMVNPLTTEQYPTPAVRPANSRLDSSALAEDFGPTLPRWSTTLPLVQAELVAQMEEA